LAREDAFDLPAGQAGGVAWGISHGKTLGWRQ
jgi:hypothetical protein